LSFKNVSASSISNVGRHLSIDRNNAAGEMLAAGNALGVIWRRNRSRVLFPHSIVGDVTAKIGAM
jgi:hypothetical protein